MNENYTLLNKDIVLDKIRNLKQITFEVTDACNLKCK
jgi:molybdenum cofactor biosynthesis enzyme MoaA